MPTSQQLADLTKIGAARQQLADAERAIRDLAASLAELPPDDPRIKRQTAELNDGFAERDRLVEQLTKLRAAVVTNGDELGAGVLDRALPVVLLPVRLETRYTKDVLRVRIYPDDVHRDAHEPALTDTEFRARERYLKLLDGSADRPPWVAAWRDLVAQVGAARALHLATLDDPAVTGRRPGTWSRATVARLLPERFVAYVWLAGAVTPIRALAPALVREPLAVGPDPFSTDGGDDAPLGEAARWLHDYDEALRAGMAIDVPLGASDAVVERVVVLGVRASVDAQAQAAELEALLAAHERGDGLALLVPGVPTNALDGARPLHTTRPDPDALYARALEYRLTGGALRRRDPAYLVRQPLGGQLIVRDAAAFALSEALGITPLTFGYADGAADATRRVEPAVRELLRAAFADGVARALAPSVPREAVDTVFEVLIGEVSALGPWSTLAVGAQPYGVLPVRLPDRRRLDPFDAGLFQMLDGLRTSVFADAVGRVPYVGGVTPGEPEALLAQLLRADGVARTVRVRGVVAPLLADEVVAALGTTDRDLLRNRSAVVDLLDRLGIPSAAASGVARMLPLTSAAPVDRPLVAPAAAEDGDVPAVYLGWLRTLPLDELLAAQYPAPAPAGLLFHLARAAVLAAADADERRTLVEDGGVDPSEFDVPGRALGTVARRLASPTPADPITPLGARLRLPNVPEARELSRVDGALALLAALPPDTLEMLVGGALGLLSHRLDAWYGGFATHRLRDIRGNPPPGAPEPDGFLRGLGAGAYGWLERIPRRAADSSAGHVLARSAQHAATAGVLLSVDAAHRGAGHGGAFAVDLSSARVRAALELLDGVRAGQAFEALLGYRIERALVDAGGTAPALIARLREAAPLIANRLTPGSASPERVAASNVADGLALVRLATADGTAATSVDRLPAAVIASIDASQRTALVSALAAAADAVDAVGDVVLAESVFHVVGGQPARSGAATDVLAGTFVTPPESDVVATPVRGIATTHRVVIALDPQAPRGAWNATPRTRAEPLVDAWAASLLPSPSAVRLRARWSDAAGPIGGTVDLTLDALLAAARTAGRADLAVGALDVALGSLAPRLAPLVELQRPASAVGATLELLLARDVATSASDVTIAELSTAAAALRALLGPGRALRPDDVPFGAAVDIAEVEARLTAAGAAVGSVRAALAGAATDAARMTALLDADHVGVPVRLDAGQLTELAAAARTQLDERLAAAADTTVPASDRLRALLGGTLPIVPRLAIDADAATAFQEDLGATPADRRAFLARAARVRVRLALLRAVLGNADALCTTGAYALHVAQRPRAAGERWTALTGSVAGGRTSVVAIGGAAIPGAGGVLAGLFVDDWVETIPAAAVDASLAFHLPAPASAAPNALLLCVPEEGTEGWTEATLLAHVLEARELARLRAVDPDLLGAAAATASRAPP